MRWSQGELRGVSRELAAIAERAGREVLARQAGAQLRSKPSGEPVTDADRASHAVLQSALASAFPGVPLVMEEQDNVDSVPSQCVVVDELDGTSVFAHGCQDWGIALALLDDCEPVAGVLHQPAADRTIVASKHGGTWLDERRLQLEARRELAQQIVLFEINRQLPAEGWEQLRALSARALVVKSLGTSLGSAVELLLGRACLFVNWRGGKIWDFAAAALAISEANGVTLSCRGAPLEWNALEMGAMLASDPAIAGATLACLRGER